MSDPYIKETLKKEAERKKTVEKARAERQKKLNTSLGIKSFLGFEFLSLSETNQMQVVKPLKRQFRSYKEATLSYTSEKRLYKVAISDSVPKRSKTEIEAELTALSNMFEKKYNFKFEKPLECSGDLHVTGGGTSISGGRVVCAPRTIVRLPWRTWNRSYEWKDFILVIEGKIPINDNADVNSHISVSFTMKGISEEDRNATLKSASEDENGIDVL